MRRIVIGALVVLAMGAAAYLTLGRRPSGPDPAQAPLPPVRTGGAVVAEGRVVPVRGVTLSLPAGGTVAEVAVREGERVQAGQLLVRTEEARQADAAVAQAEAQLRRAQARLAELRAGATQQDLAAARAAVDAARARHAQLQAGAREQERAQAQAAAEAAERRAASVEARGVQAEAALRLAEEDLRRTERLLAMGAISQQAADQSRARVTQTSAELEAARAEAAAARAQAAQARQQAGLVAAGARPEELEVAAADVRRAQAQLDQLTAGARAEAIAAAEADVAAARAAVRQARVSREQAELRAPFAGTVAWIGPRAGEFVAPGAPVIRVGDLTAWQVETTDLTELSVVSVREGDRVTVTFDGIPDLSIGGTVQRIRAFGENRLGDITYTVAIALDRQDPRFHWNMTASVTIERQ
ncbi:MAG: HlyD family efflux transporter periplasmic adaptor subunit [Armatimonadota bacterium]|nr:HlyD family efflux transporter periplasmic adaptor subunit [Armatimonadota bacterium]